MRMGRVEEARRSIAWALQVDPGSIPLPAAAPPVEQTRWLELFNYPRSLVAGCLTGLTQTGGVALALWMVTLFVMVLGVTPAEASKLVIWVSVAAVAGRFLCSWISDSMGRRASGLLSCLLAALFMSLAGYLNSVFIGGVSMFFVMIVLQNFFGSGNYSIVGPYMGELWPARLRGSGMGLVYGVGNLGKFIGPAGLALIAGSSNYVAPQATLEALIPAFNYFAFWYVLGAIAFWFIGFETRGRSIEEIDTALSASAHRRWHLDRLLQPSAMKFGMFGEASPACFAFIQPGLVHQAGAVTSKICSNSRSMMRIPRRLFRGALGIPMSKLASGDKLMPDGRRCHVNDSQLQRQQPNLRAFVATIE